MRKFTVLTLFVLLIMVFGTTIYAQKLDFKVSGYIDAQTFWDKNVPPRNLTAGIIQVTDKDFAFTTANTKEKSLDRSRAYLDSRAILRFDAVMDKNLSGTIIFEIDAYRWGGSAGPTGAAGTGAPGGTLTLVGERNTVGVWSTDRAAVEVKNVYIDFGLPYFGIPVPMTVRVGAQPFGVRPQILVYTDGAGIMGAINLNPVTIIPMWAKVSEGVDWAADDADLYGLHVNAKLGTFTVGGYGLYYNMNTYPLAYPTGVNWPSTMVGSKPLLAGNAPAFVTSSTFGLYAAGTQRADFWWLGLYADGKAGPVNLNFDFVYDQGKVKEKLFDLGVPNVKYRGWATRLKVDFPWEKFNFGVVGMHASGADTNKTSISGVAGTSAANPAAAPALSTRVSSYVVPVGSEQDTNNNESIVVYGTDAGASGGIGIAKNANYNQVTRGGFGGTWFAKLYSSMKVLSWYKVTLQGLYIGDTTKHGNTLSNAVKPGTTALRDDKDIGFELDLINEINIYKNLAFTFGAGYLWAGDALDIKRGTLNTNYSPKNPWAVRTRLMYTF
jgi:hypothetical protein